MTAFKANANLPWPVAVTLGAYSRKHIFAPSKYIPINKYLSAVSDFCNRASWRMHLDGVDSNWYSSFRCRRPCSEFFGITAPEIKAFISYAKHHLRNSVSSPCVSRHGVSFLRFHKYALQWLREQNLCAELSDKDGGFTLVDKTALKEMVSRKLVSPQYMRIAGAADMSALSVKKIMHKHARAIGSALSDEGLTKHLHRQLNLGTWTKLAGNVLSTVKTHKEPGMVSCRIIHSGVNNPTTPLAKVLVHYLRKNTSSIDFLYGSSDSLLQNLRTKRFPGGVVFYKIDVADFYMQGKPGFHKKLAFNNISPSNLSKALKDCLEDVLCNQFVVYDGAYFRLGAGSGQGQIASGDISDNSFYEKVEHDLIVPECMSKHGVHWYGRYRDDILIIAERGGMQTFFSKMKALAQEAWKLECTDVSSRSVAFLDFELIKDLHFFATGQLSYRLYRKPTSQHVPLGASSMHPKYVHNSWPRAELARIARRSSNFNTFRDAIMTTCDRWCTFDLSLCLDKYSLPDIFYFQRPPNTGDDSTKIFWLVLPFHACYDAAPVKRTIASIVSLWRPIMKGIIGEFDIRISYRSFYPSLARRLQSHNTCSSP